MCFSYAFVVHGKGPAVLGQGDVFNADDTTTSSDVVLKGNLVRNIKCWTNEIPGKISDGMCFVVYMFYVSY